MTASAQERFWQAADGPYGGTIVNAVAATSARELLAGTPGGVYLSVDGGQSWEGNSEGLGGREVKALLQLTDGSVLAGTAGDGVYSLNPASPVWRATGLRGVHVISLSQDSTGVLFAGTIGGMLRSTDNGINWKEIPYFKNTSGGVKAIAASRGSVFAGGLTGLYRSTDSGQTWAPAMAGLREAQISALAVSAKGEVFVGTSPTSGLGGVYRSLNDGQVWTRLPLMGNAYQINTIGFDYLGSVYVGGYRMVYRSHDGGNTWEQALASPTSVQAFAFLNDRVFAATFGRGISQSPLYSLDFSESNEGLYSTVHDLAVARGVIYAATSGGVYLSWDHGRNWDLIDGGLDALAVSTLEVDANGLMLAGTKTGIYRLYENMTEWSKISPPGTPEVRDIAMAPDGTLYAGYHSGL
ncbi:MAG: hypothetical protein WED81_08560, partial [Rhodothermales bacterium]